MPYLVLKDLIDLFVHLFHKFEATTKVILDFLDKRRLQIFDSSHCAYTVADGLVEPNKLIDPFACFSEKKQFLPELIKLNRTLQSPFWDRLPCRVALVDEMKPSLQVGPKSPNDWRQCSRHYSSFQPLSSFLIPDYLLPLRPGHVDGYANGRDAADGLNPGRPINIEWRSGLWWVFAKQRPHQKCAREKGHQSHHRPIPVCSSLFHDFPLLLARILPSGVAA